MNTNRFDINNKYTTIVTHNGRFHADDVMFCALVRLVCKASGTVTPSIVRIGSEQELANLSIDFDTAIIGDVLCGAYDHHEHSTSFDTFSVSAFNNPERGIRLEPFVSSFSKIEIDEYCVGKIQNRHYSGIAACGLLFSDIKNLLFGPEDSLIRKYFELLLASIQLADSTPVLDAFSEHVAAFNGNNIMPCVDSETEGERFLTAVSFCEDVIRAFISLHEKEISHDRILRKNAMQKALATFSEEQIQKLYGVTHIHQNDPTVRLWQADTFKLVCFVLKEYDSTLFKHWNDMIQDILKKNKNEIKTLQRTELIPLMKDASREHRHYIVLPGYIPFSDYTQHSSVLFIIYRSARGDINIQTVNGPTGPRCGFKFFESDKILFKADDGRFVSVATIEDALEIVQEIDGEVIRKFYLDSLSLLGYINLYGGKLKNNLVRVDNGFRALLFDLTNGEILTKRHVNRSIYRELQNKIYELKDKELKHFAFDVLNHRFTQDASGFSVDLDNRIIDLIGGTYRTH